MRFFLVGPYYPLRGGIAQYIGVLGQKLIGKGHQVKVLAFRKQFPKFLFPGQTQIEPSQEYIDLETDAVFVPWNPLTWFRTFLHARRGQPDALVFKYWMPFFAPGFAAVCALIKRFSPIRIIYILDNVIPHEKRAGDQFFTRLAFRWVDAFVIQSEVVRRDLNAWFPEAENREVKLVPHPIYDCYSDAGLSKREARQKLGLRPEGILLLFFGLVRRYKGLDVLLEAMPAVITEFGDDVHLLIAGEFYDREEIYVDQINKLGISKSVTLINRYVPNEEVNLYFRAADLLVLPYRSATQSGVIQVAFRFGLPVISTTVGGLPEVIKNGETGFLVEPEKPNLLSEAIIKFFRESWREKMGENLLKIHDRYSWDGMIDTLVHFAQKSDSHKPNGRRRNAQVGN